MPDAGCRMPDAGCRMPDAGCRMRQHTLPAPWLDDRFSSADAVVHPAIERDRADWRFLKEFSRAAAPVWEPEADSGLGIGYAR